MGKHMVGGTVFYNHYFWFSVAIDLILFKLANKEEMHNILFRISARLDDEKPDLAALSIQNIPPLVYKWRNGVYCFSWLFT